MVHPSSATRSLLAPAVAVLLCGFLATTTRADLVVTAHDSTAQVGGSGSFDVTIQNTGATPIDVGGFQIELSIPGASGILFTDATRATALTYLFAAAPGPDPLNADPGNPFPNVVFVASDSYFDLPGFQTIGAGETLGLVHVLFNVDPSAAIGPVTVSIIGANTLFTEGIGPDTLAFTRNNGTITLVPTTIPEPSTLMLAGVGGALLLVRRQRRRASRSRDNGRHS